MEKFRKIFTAGVMLTTILSMNMAVIPTAKAAASAGDLIKMDGLSSVYFLGKDGKRYVFPNEATYFSWYSDFSGVVTVPQAELESYPLGANVTMRPGTKLVKITTNPKVYAVEANGVLRPIPDEATAKSLYGDNWNKKVVDVADAFFTNYTTSNSNVAAGTYPMGSLIKKDGDTTVYYIDATGKARKVASEAAMMANRFKSADVITAPASFVMPTMGADMLGAEDGVVYTAQNGAAVGVQPGAGTGASVALSGSTAPSSTLIVGQASANLASFNITASNDGEVKVTSFKVRRNGVSADATINAAYLYNGETRLTDNASVSSGYITWNNSAGIFTVPAGQTKTITVRADLAGTAGETVGVYLEGAAHIVTNGAAIAGTFPIYGNIHSLASATLASFSFGTPTPSTAGTMDAGEVEYSVWKSSVTVGTRAVNLESIRFRQIGSILPADVKDIKFFVDGVQKGTVQQLGADNYVAFDLSGAPVKLDTGTRNLELRASIIGGANRTFSFSVQYKTDVRVKDSEYNAYVSAASTPASTETTTVNTGSLTITKMSDSPSGNITKDASNATLGKYEFKAYGESVKVEYLRVYVTSSNDTGISKMRNGAIYANGVQIGSTADINSTTASTTAYTDYSLGSSLIVEPGKPVIVEVKSDIYDNDSNNNVSAGDYLKATLDARTSSGQRLTSLGYITVPSADVDGNTLTVTEGSISMAKVSSYGDQNMVAPQSSGYKIGSYVLTGNSTEPVNLNTFTLTFTGGGSNATFLVGDLSDVYIKYGSKTTSIKSSVASSTTWSISETLPVNGTMVIDVYAVVGSSITADDTLQTSLKVDGITANSSASKDTGTVTGQVITAKAGSIDATLDAATPVLANVKGNSTIEAAKYKFTTQNDSYKVTEVKVVVGSATNASAINRVILKDGATEIASGYISATTTTFSGLNVMVPANDSKVLTVALELGSIGTGAGTSGTDVKITLDQYKYIPTAGGTEATDGDDVAAKDLYVFKALPTVTNQALPTTTLAAGTQTLAKFTVSADGTIEWKQFLFTVTKSTGPIVTNVKMYDAASNEEITGTATLDLLGASSTAGTIKFVATNEQAVSGSKTYLLKGDVSGTLSDNNYISTKIGQNASGHTAPAAYTSVAASSTFTWSDINVASHSSSTADWNDDYLIKNIPTDSQTLTK